MINAMRFATHDVLSHSESLFKARHEHRIDEDP